jgi:hypothetical protein
MQASHQDLAVLLEIQQLDLNIMNLTKQLEALPQRKVILDARARKQEIKAKQAKILSMKQQCAKKVNSYEDEISSLKKKEHGIQAAIEAAGNDFRNVEMRAKELDGICRRLQTVEADLAQAREKFSQIEEVELKADTAFEEFSATEETATEAFKAKGSELRIKIVTMEHQKAALAKNIEPQIKRLYDYSAERQGGVAIGKLEGARCGVCRTPIDSGHLADLRAEAPLGKCPVCHRLLIIE